MHKPNIDDIVKKVARAEIAEIEEMAVVSETEPRLSREAGGRKAGADKIISKFLTIWITLAVFATPLIVVSWVYPAQALAQLALFVFALVGIVVWLGRAFWLRRDFIWYKSAGSWGALGLVGAVILSSLFSGRAPAVWGLAGFITNSSPLAWLAPILLGLLIIQHAAGSPRRLRHLLATFAVSSTLLALFVLGWYFIQNQFLLVWGLAPQSVALWFTLAAGLVFTLAATTPLARGGGAKWLWFAAGLLHLGLLFFFDYDLIWYFLGGSMLLFGLLQWLYKKKLGRVDYIVPQLVILLSLALLLAPVTWLIGGQQAVFNSGNLVPFSLSSPRYYQYAAPNKKLLVFGVGPGFGTTNLWQWAELADMRQVVNFPQLGNGYLALLWEGGALFALAFLVFVFGLFYGVAKRIRGSGAMAVALPALTVLLAALAAFWFLPLSFAHIFILFFLAALLSASLTEIPSPFKGEGQSLPRTRYGGEVLESGGDSDGEVQPSAGGAKGIFSWRLAGSEERQFFAALATAAPLAVLTLFIFGWLRQFDARLSFLQVITRNDKGAPVVNVDRLQRAIDFSPAALGYRVSRNDIALQLLRQQDKPKFNDVQGLFLALRSDTAYLLGQNLTGAEKWQLAWQAELTAANLELKEFADKEKGSLNAEAKNWYQVAGQIYEQAAADMPRNVILLTEAARFYRQHAALLATPEVGAQKFYDRSQALTASALGIDPSYESGYLEKIELAAITKSPSEALAEIAGFADKSPNLAFRAGQLAFAAKNYNLAARYYGQAVAGNENHLAARYELVRSYGAAGEPEKAKKALVGLEPRVPTGDAQVDKLMQDLRASLGNAPAEAPAKPAPGGKPNKQ